ncbi:bucky ball [Brachionichthys hirsutus]|uniref:bucky ball n=1 Tax=Brachionichthys hirsutus TaxID=412623 RepID=UPI0036045398
MDEEGKPAHAFGSGPQRNQHPRPFFYVQPPSQPYFLYPQWQLSNPYSQYGLPGGFNFPRPYMHPYQYVQYPGYAFPHAPLYPMEHRRVFEPRFQGPPWSDAPRQPYQPYPQGRRETACSEAQTDPSDAITKLIECLDKFRGGEMQCAERELDSGVASQSSGMFSPGAEKKSEQRGQSLPPEPDGSHLEAPAACGDATTAACHTQSNQRSVDTLSPQTSWTGGMEDESPLDTSSVHEDGRSRAERPAGDESFLRLEKAAVTGIQPDTSVTGLSAPVCGEDLLKLDPVSHQTQSVPPGCSDRPKLQDDECADEDSKTEHQKADEGSQILELPYDSLTPGGATAAASHLSSPAASYFYNYLSMHTTRERMSVLSPSLDEISSRDEMFSTDLDDADLFPKHVYTGRRLAEAVSGSSQAAEDVEEAWPPGSKKSSCSCCGKSLAKAASRSKVHSAKTYRDEAGDSEEDGRYGRGCEPPVRVVTRKHSGARKAHSVPPKHAARPWHKRGQYKDPSDGADQEESRNPCKQELVDGEMSKEPRCRTCQDRHFREDLTSPEQSRRGDGDPIHRRRPAAPLQRQEMSAQRKVMYHRPRDDDDEPPPPLHWERGSVMRESRC